MVYFIAFRLREYSGGSRKVGIRGGTGSAPTRTLVYTEAVEALATIGLAVHPEKPNSFRTSMPEVGAVLPGTNKTGQGMVVLGRVFDVQERTDMDLRMKESLAWARFHRILPVLRQKTPLRHCLRIFYSCVLQKILWCAESWCCTKRCLQHLRAIHTRMLRYMISPPGHIQGLDIGERVIQHAHYVPELSQNISFQVSYVR